MSRLLARFGVPVASVAIIAYLLFPVLVVILISFSSARFLQFPPPGFSLQWYERVLQSWDWPASLMVSLQVGGICTLIAVVLGVPAAFALVRHAVPAKALINALLLAALITPPIVMAIALYLFLLPMGLLNSVLVLGAVHAVSGVPFVVINVAASLKGFDRTLERAAIIHGATPLGAIRQVTLPVIAPAIVIGAIFAFLQSTQELLVAMFLMGTIRKPFAVKLWEGVRESVDPTIAAASSVFVLLAVLAFISAALLNQYSRRLTQAQR